MKVTEQDVLYVANLANLELTPEERAGMVRDLNSILNFVEVLDELDTKDVAPMAQVSEGFGAEATTTASSRFAYVAREDVATPAGDSPPPPGADEYSRTKRSLPREEAMQNAPETDGALFKVPKVIER